MPDDFDFTSYRRKRAIDNTPYITYALIAASVVLTAAYWLSMEKATATSLISRLSVSGVRMESRIWEGSLYYFLINIFYHGSWAHLLFNMYWTYKLGVVLETTLPRYAYLGFIVGSAIISNGVELAIFGATGIGMSGVGYALFGLLWAGRGKYESWRFTVSGETYKTFVVWAVICVITTYMGIMNVANGAHFGGMLFGMAIGWLFVAPRRKMEWAIPLALMIGLTVLSLTWLPWRTEWHIHKSEQALRRQDVPGAIRWYERGLKSIGDKQLLYFAGIEAWMAAAKEADSKKDEKGFLEATQRVEEIEKRVQEVFESYQRGATRNSAEQDIQKLQESIKGNKGERETHGD